MSVGPEQRPTVANIALELFGPEHKPTEVLRHRRQISRGSRCDAENRADQAVDVGYLRLLDSRRRDPHGSYDSEGSRNLHRWRRRLDVRLRGQVGNVDEQLGRSVTPRAPRPGDGWDAGPRIPGEGMRPAKATN